MKIAFIGLGNMGGGMAANLVKAGHEVHAFDLMGAARQAAAEHGCIAFDDAGEAVKDVDAVVTMLPNGAIVKSVYTGSVIGKAPKGAVLLDCSTIDVATARQVIAAAEDAGYAMVGVTLAILGWRLGRRLGLVGAGLGVVMQGLALLVLDARLIAVLDRLAAG